MPSSFVSHHVHLVFSTKDRVKLIPQELQPKLWAYIAGVARNHGMHAIAVGGIGDHVHALVEVGATLGISKAVQLLKANSSRWMNEHRGTRFAWQEGYFACSVSRSQTPTVMRYISNQKAHHHRMDFEREFELLLQKHGVHSASECGVPSGLNL